MFSRLRLGWLRFWGGLANLAGLPGFVQEAEYVSGEGATVRVRKSALYTVVTVNGVDAYFYRLTGGIDGIGVSQTSDCMGYGTAQSAGSVAPSVMPVSVIAQTQISNIANRDCLDSSSVLKSGTCHDSS